jgi:hypothetical protein
LESPKLASFLTFQDTSQLAARSFIPDAYAEANIEQPKWLSSIPSSKGSLYFLGAARNTSLKTAQKESLENALKNASSFISRQLIKLGLQDTSIDKINILSKLAASASKIEDSFFERQKGIFIFYTLLRFDKTLSNIDLKLLEIEDKVSISEMILSSILNIEQVNIEYIWLGNYDHIENLWGKTANHVKGYKS